MNPIDAGDTRGEARYQTIVRIGRGGMGEVLLSAVESGGVTKLAVLKSLWPEHAANEDFLQMFLDEARLGARLAHPNVVQMYGVARHAGRPALAMEYLEGQPLTAVLTRIGGQLPLGDRLGIVTAVLSGLEYVHNLADFDGTPLDVVHRDVSPHNVIVTYEGHVKLIDFGVAKTLASQHETRPGGMKGKIAYLAPEALRGDAVDRRTDVFSVGVMLWEMLANRRFWAGTPDGTIAWRLSTGQPAPELPATLDIPHGLRAVCRKALAHDPDARHQSAAELAADLYRYGALTSESHARHLGTLVSRAFAVEREQRRAVIEFQLRGGTTPRPDLTPYDSLELEGVEDARSVATDSSDETVIHDRAFLRTAAEVAAGELETTPLPETQSAVRRLRRRARSHAAFVGAATVVLAIAWGSHVARDVAVPARPAVSTAAPQEPAAPPPAAAPAKPLVVEAPAEPAERRERRATRPRRPAIDLLSDEVLDLDGSPVAPGQGASRGARD